jgi:hypothetical protein
MKIEPYRQEDQGLPSACDPETDHTTPPIPNPNPDTPEPSTNQLPGFAPKDIFYESAPGKYHVDLGTHYRTYKAKGPIVRGVTARFVAEAKDEKDEKKAPSAAATAVNSLEIEQACDWAGGIAGYKKGLKDMNGFTALITEQALMITPKSGSCPVIEEILEQSLGKKIQLSILKGWLSIALKAVIAGKHQPGQLFCLAGGANVGKSLLCKVISSVLGGRVGDPYTAWTGSMLWNDDLIRAELLVIDDSVSSTDPRARRALAARFKEAIYANNVQMRKRNCTSMCFRPVWRAVICCNDNPEALQIIPGIDEDLSDKVTILRVEKISPRVDTSTPDGREQFWKLIEAELPAFVAYLLDFQIPDQLKDSRAGIIAYRDPTLEEAVLELSPEKRLEEMLARMMDSGHLMDPGESVIYTATDLQGRMVDRDSPVSDQARGLFSRWPAACGVYLGKLSARRPELVKKAGKRNGIQQWKITRPDNAGKEQGGE